MKHFWMMTTALAAPVMTWAPNDGAGAAGGAGADAGAGGGTQQEGGDGGAGAGGGAGDGGQAGGGNGTGDGGGAGGAGAGGDGSGGAGSDKPWYEAREWSDPKLKEFAIKAGYHNGTPEAALEKALKGEMTATAKLGKNPASLVELPGKDGSVMDFLKGISGSLGMPESVEKYELSVPEDLPEGMPVDDKMLAGFKQAAFEAGVPPAVAQQSLDFYANHMKDWFGEQTQKVQELEAKLESELKQKWGGNWERNRDLGARAFQAIAAKMELDPAVTLNVATKLNEGLGDVHLVQFTYGLAELIGEDQLAAPGGGSGNTPSAILAQAQQRKAQIMGGEMRDARGDAAKIKQLQAELKRANDVILAHQGKG